jgi:hypothetical protein
MTTFVVPYLSSLWIKGSGSRRDDIELLPADMRGSVAGMIVQDREANPLAGELREIDVVLLPPASLRDWLG